MGRRTQGIPLGQCREVDGNVAMFQSSPGLEIQGSNQGEKISILSSSGSVRIGSSAASELPPL